MILKALIESLVEAEMSVLDTPTIWCDSDGVLANFDEGILQNSKRAEKAREEYMRILQGFPEFMHITDDELKTRLAGPQVDPGMKALKKAWNNYRQLKFAIAGQPGFFLGLPEMPGAKEMLSRIAEMTGRKPNILTAPIEGNTERCEQEKRQWFEQHFPGMFDKFVCTQDKQNYASPNSILIDDRTKYTSKFEANGGIAILHKNPADTLAKLENILKSRGLPV